MMTVARGLLIIGLIFLLAAGIVYLAARFNLYFGRLPGDIRIERENYTCLFPLATMLLLSFVLTVVLNIIVRLLGRK